MFEINGEDINKLNDTDLRSLIGLLCEADLCEQGIPTAGVTWGGHQNAKDGGIDVRVELTSTLVEDGFIPRSNTGFQVKKPDMPRSAILEEMQPNGRLREVIKDLIQVEGAYIIVSSQGSTADSALTSRKEAMREALSGYSNQLNLKVDFYDRERIAGWVRQHPTLVLWVRKKIGKPIQGWQPYENWARCPGGIEEEYIVDEQIRFYDSSVNPSVDGYSIVDGINKVRTLLHKPASSVRLVGLSGVGKTRFLQVLFDDRIGESPLNKNLVYYTDISDSPNPDPRNFTEQILALRKPAILAIDNCPPDLHRSLTKICAQSGSLVRLITIEYDVREDQPEETNIVRLEPATTELIENIVLSRFSYISKVNARSIAEFSGGNARIAIALANTVEHGENLSALKDDDLFTRLFRQRNESSSSLMRAAEACSLVYSFDVQTISGNDIELKLLSSLVDMNVRELYRNIRELKQRDLIQARSVWRAVLPQAIANKLAERALQSIPIDEIRYVFEEGGSERLLRSFSRRLSYLHECEEAKEVVQGWLADEGMLGDISNLNDLGVSLLMNVASVQPELVLNAIEKVALTEKGKLFFTRENNYYNEYTRLLRSIAYDEKFFERSASLLCRFALSEKPNENNNSIRSLLKSLFQLYLSGTHASVEQRLNVIKGLVESDSEEKIDLGISLLDAALKTRDFGSFYGFEFGARPRDYGFSPRDKIEFQNWYRVYLDFTSAIAISTLKSMPAARRLLAEHFRGLWTKTGLYNELESAIDDIATRSSWNEGWLAVRRTKKYDGQKMDITLNRRIDILEEKLRPRTLTDQAITYALNPIIDLIDVQGDKRSDKVLKIREEIREIGKKVGRQEEIFKEILPKIVSNEKKTVNLFDFGRGLAAGSVNHEKIWIELCEQLQSIEETKRSYEVLCGYLHEVSQGNTQLVDEILDKAVTNDVLAKVYPLLQVNVEVGIKGLERLKKSLEYGVAPICQYKSLGVGCFFESIGDDGLVDFLKNISTKLGGIEVAIDILSDRLFGHTNEEPLSVVIISFGKELLLKYPFNQDRKHRAELDYELSVIIRASLTGESDEEIIKSILNKIIGTQESYYISFEDFNDVLKELIKIQPITFLNEFFKETTDTDFIFQSRVREHSYFLDYIDNDTINEWLEVNKSKRFPEIASAIVPFKMNKEDGLLEWTTLALKLIEESGDPVVMLNILKSSFYPMSWSGSRAALMRTRLPLFNELKAYTNSRIADWAVEEEKVFRETIDVEEERELTEERSLNERFE